MSRAGGFLWSASSAQGWGLRRRSLVSLLMRIAVGWEETHGFGGGTAGPEGKETGCNPLAVLVCATILPAPTPQFRPPIP